MNPFFAYLIKSSLSIALFYIVFKLAVSRDKMHAVNRFVLLAILISSTLLPLADISILHEAEVIPTVEVFREFVAAPVFNTPTVSEPVQTIPQTKSISINWYLVFYLSIISFLFLRLLISTIRVVEILKGAKKQAFQKIILAVVTDFIQPFSFLNNIVISEKDYTENREIVMAHEYAHIKHLHAIDLIVCELFTAIHWFNPFMWFLRRDLKLIHEFQADQAVLNNGIDAKKYQLLVLQKSVGERRFAMANHFTQKPILKRLKMMQKKNRKQWTGLKIILFIPILMLLLQAFAKPELIVEKANDFIPELIQQDDKEKWLERWTIENIGQGVFQPEIESLNLQKKHNNILVILLNRNNDFLIEDEYAKKEQVKQIVKDFLAGKDRKGKIVVDYLETEIPLIGKMDISKGVISFRHDLDSSDETINFALRSIGEACLDARHERARILFGKDYFALEGEKREAIDIAVPVRFSKVEPKMSKPPPPPPPVRVSIEKGGEVYMLKKKYSFDELEQKLNQGRISWEKTIEMWEDEYKSLQANYDYRVHAKVYVGEGVTEEELNPLKEAFQNAKILEKNILYIVDDKPGKQKAPPPPPPPLFLVQLYENGVTVWDVTVNDAEVNVINSEVSKKAQDFLKRVGEKYTASIRVFESVSEDRVAAMTEMLKKAGMKNIKIRKMD